MHTKPLRDSCALAIRHSRPQTWARTASAVYLSEVHCASDGIRGDQARWLKRRAFFEFPKRLLVLNGSYLRTTAMTVSPADAAARKTKVIAPAGFTEAVLGEAVIDANARARRGQYQFGASLPVGERTSI
jgi:hypothetical protein